MEAIVAIAAVGVVMGLWAIASGLQRVADALNRLAREERLSRTDAKWQAERSFAVMSGEYVPGVGVRVRRCSVCGCTDDRACPGGCSWVDASLCSTCAPAQVGG